MDGQVQLTQGGQVLASQAVVNTPLSKVCSCFRRAEQGKAEIQFEDGSVARPSRYFGDDCSSGAPGNDGQCPVAGEWRSHGFELQGGNSARPDKRAVRQ